MLGADQVPPRDDALRQVAATMDAAPLHREVAVAVAAERDLDAIDDHGEHIIRLDVSNTGDHTPSFCHRNTTGTSYRFFPCRHTPVRARAPAAPPLGPASSYER